MAKRNRQLNLSLCHRTVVDTENAFAILWRLCAIFSHLFVIGVAILTTTGWAHNCQATQTTAAATKPNIVLFVVDDMGIMDTSVPFLVDSAGRPRRYPLNNFYRTPNMEQLAAVGIRFSDFYAMSVCSPTRISIMTGQNAARHRTTNWIDPERNNRGPFGPPNWNWQGLDRADITLPRLLRQAGYRTIHVGKGHFGPAGSEGSSPLCLGFDRNVGGHSAGRPASYYGSENYGNGPTASINSVPDLSHYHGRNVYLTEALTLEANRLVTEAVQDGQPFFLYMAHYAVHAPFQADPRFAANYQQSDKGQRAQAFATMIEGVDKSLGDLLDHLESLGIAENTLLFFLGDNGTDAPLGEAHEVACAAPLRGKKGSHYEGGIRVPFIAAWARPDRQNPFQEMLPIAAGKCQSQIASVCDLMPTLVELVDAHIPETYVMDGHSMKMLLAGKVDSSKPNTFLMHYPHAPHRSDYFTCYRRDQWKLIYHYFPTDSPHNVQFELFDLENDLSESNNLAAGKPRQLQRMFGEMVALLENQNVQYPISRPGETPLRPNMP